MVRDFSGLSPFVSSLRSKALYHLGDVVYLDACGQPMIILGTHEDAMELLDKRAANYSDRKFSSMAELSVPIQCTHADTDPHVRIIGQA